MENYKVFEIDICFDEFSIDYVLVGAKDREDLVAHIKDVFDLNQYYTPEELDDAEICEIEPMFTDEQYAEICKAYEGEEINMSRIKEVEHLTTDIPYRIISGYSYTE